MDLLPPQPWPRWKTIILAAVLVTIAIAAALVVRFIRNGNSFRITGPTKQTEKAVKKTSKPSAKKATAKAGKKTAAKTAKKPAKKPTKVSVKGTKGKTAAKSTKSATAPQASLLTIPTTVSSPRSQTVSPSPAVVSSAPAVSAPAAVSSKPVRSSSSATVTAASPCPVRSTCSKQLVNGVCSNFVAPCASHHFELMGACNLGFNCSGMCMRCSE